eukprot:5760853-Amphidinium_carterae.1
MFMCYLNSATPCCVERTFLWVTVCVCGSTSGQEQATKEQHTKRKNNNQRFDLPPPEKKIQYCVPIPFRTQPKFSNK